MSCGPRVRGPPAQGLCFPTAARPLLGALQAGAAPAVPPRDQPGGIHGASGAPALAARQESGLLLRGCCPEKRGQKHMSHEGEFFPSPAGTA